MATIATLRGRLFRAPTADGVAMSFAPLAHRAMLLVEVTLDDGTIGLGETWVNFPSWAWQERRATLAEGVAPLVVGQSAADLEDVRRLVRTVLDALGPIGRQWGAPGPVHQAVSGLELALWDAIGRSRGESIAQLVRGPGSTHPDVELLAYGSSLGPSGVAETAERCLSLGLRAVKAKVGFGRDADLSTIRTIREVMGEDVKVFADANQAWKPAEAVEMVHLLADHGVGWVEEPLAGDDALELAELAAATGMPLATGENVYGCSGFTAYLGVPGLHILQPDLTKCGGPTAYLSVVERARGTGQRVAPHLYNGAVAAAATLQVAAATGAPFVEWDVRHNPLREPVDHLLTSRGTLVAPAGPGIGLELDLSTLSRYEEVL